MAAWGYEFHLLVLKVSLTSERNERARNTYLHFLFISIYTYISFFLTTCIFDFWLLNFCCYRLRATSYSVEVLSLVTLVK